MVRFSNFMVFGLDLSSKFFTVVRIMESSTVKVYCIVKVAGLACWSRTLTI